MPTSTRSRPRASTRRETSGRRPGRNRFPTGLAIAGIVGLVVAAVVLGSDTDGAAGGAGVQAGPGGFNHQVGEPGPGQPAPAIELSAGGGGTFDLAAARGETVLLYFQEGLMCQPCWDQLTEIESRWTEFEDLGLDRVVTVTTDPVGALGQKVDLEGIRSPVLSDAGKDVSRAYDTLAYGMMGGTHNGHTFLVVGPDGGIVWRADYGGAPDYTMYMPADALLRDLETGLGDGAGA